VGQKTHPIGLRLGIIRTWSSRWFATRREYAKLLKEDQTLRAYVNARLARASVSIVEIERAPKRVQITVHTARPGIVIGRKGTEVDKLRDELRHLTNKEIFINIQEIKRPELDAKLVADNVRRQIEGRVLFRRAMKKALDNTMRMGAEGIRIACAGRLNGAEMSRNERYARGRVPLHTLRADIDYAQVTALTTYGAIGIKVWICRGEVLDNELTVGMVEKHEPDNNQGRGRGDRGGRR
jgi:small subunit ribosomal protein S3